MSISNLLVPNNYGLYSESLTTNLLNVNNLNVTDLTTTNIISDTVTTNSVTSDSIALNNKKNVAFSCYYIDGFGNYNTLPGSFTMTVLRVSDYVFIDFPDVDVTLPTTNTTLIFANPGVPPSGPAKLSIGEIINHNYIFNYTFRISGVRTQGSFNIPQGLDEPFDLTRFDQAAFSGTLDLYGNNFVCLVD